jgi:hypothetical protein
MLPPHLRPDPSCHAGLSLGHTFCAVLLCLSFTLLACDPEEVINDYFRKMGLTRLAVLQTDVQPGTVILMKGHEAFLGDHILDYVDEGIDPSREYGTFGGSAKDDVDAVLRRFSDNTRLSGKMAMTFLISVFRLTPNLNLGLSDSVTIDMVDAKVRKMKVASLEKFLTRNESLAFQQKVREWKQRGLDAYVAYEVYRAKSLKVRSEEGQDVAPSLKAGTITPLPIEGEVGVAYKKIASNELLLTGDRYYAFAVKTAKFKIERTDPTVVVERTEFVKPEEWGIKSAGTDDQYAAPLVERFAPVTLQSGLPPDL